MRGVPCLEQAVHRGVCGVPSKVRRAGEHAAQLQRRLQNLERLILRGGAGGPSTAGGAGTHRVKGRRFGGSRGPHAMLFFVITGRNGRN